MGARVVTDQLEGVIEPQSIAGADPVRAYAAWRETLGRLARYTADGPLLWGVGKGDRFTRTPLSDHGVTRIVRASALRAGLPDAD